MKKVLENFTAATRALLIVAVGAALHVVGFVPAVRVAVKALQGMGVL